jgi:aldehyde dehydrogenase (NAD+)
MCCEETFGPVVSILTAPDLETAISLANETKYGLSAGVVTEDLNKALWAAEHIESGMVHINDSSVGDEPQVPFGGIKESGIGRMGGRAALEEFTELRWISYQQKHRQYPW